MMSHSGTLQIRGPFPNGSAYQPSNNVEFADRRYIEVNNELPTWVFIVHFFHIKSHKTTTRGHDTLYKSLSV